MILNIIHKFPSVFEMPHLFMDFICTTHKTWPVAMQAYIVYGYHLIY